MGELVICHRESRINWIWSEPAFLPRLTHPSNRSKSERDPETEEILRARSLASVDLDESLLSLAWVKPS